MFWSMIFVIDFSDPWFLYWYLAYAGLICLVHRFLLHYKLWGSSYLVNFNFSSSGSNFFSVEFAQTWKFEPGSKRTRNLLRSRSSYNQYWEPAESRLFQVCHLKCCFYRGCTLSRQFWTYSFSLPRNLASTSL